MWPKVVCHSQFLQHQPFDSFWKLQLWSLAKPEIDTSLKKNFLYKKIKCWFQSFCKQVKIWFFRIAFFLQTSKDLILHKHNAPLKWLPSPVYPVWQDVIKLNFTHIFTTKSWTSLIRHLDSLLARPWKCSILRQYVRWRIWKAESHFTFVQTDCHCVSQSSNSSKQYS